MDQNQLLLKQLVRQIKFLNFWVAFFGVLFLVSFAVAGLLIFKIVTYVHTSTQKISDLQTKTSQTLDLKNNICANSSVTSLLGSQVSQYCK